ncbi:MAG: hypothetical protein J6J09_04850 [Phocaeicola sp.]|nr:hypothetical protein [Phocaeicola sp.]
MLIGCLALLIVCFFLYLLFKNDPEVFMLLVIIFVPLMILAYKWELEKEREVLKKRFHGFNSYGDAIENSTSFKKLIEELKAHPESFTLISIYERISEIGNKLFGYEHDRFISQVRHEMEFPNSRAKENGVSWKKIKETTKERVYLYDRFLCQKAIYNDVVEYQEHLLDGFDVDYFDDSIQIYATVNVTTKKTATAEDNAPKKAEAEKDSKPEMKPILKPQPPVKEPVKEQPAAVVPPVDQPEPEVVDPQPAPRKWNPNDDLKLE